MKTIDEFQSLLAGFYRNVQEVTSDWEDIYNHVKGERDELLKTVETLRLESAHWRSMLKELQRTNSHSDGDLSDMAHEAHIKI